MRHTAPILSFLAILAVSSPCLAQGSLAKEPAAKPSAPFQPADTPAASDTWIFSGVLADSKQPYSGTLIAGSDGSEFELKVGGATCDGGDLKGDVGLVRLPVITCSDDRTLRALFVPQGGQSLKVFGHIGDERFSAEAHLLGTEALPEPAQTAEPRGPMGLPPPGFSPPK